MRKGYKKRAAEIWHNYQKFVQHLLSLPKSKQPKNSKSCDGHVSVVSDPFLCAKLKFVEKLSQKLNKFLRSFQADNPMIYSKRLLRWLIQEGIFNPKKAGGGQFDPPPPPCFF